MGFAAALVCGFARPAVMRAVTVVAGVAACGLSVALVPRVATRDVTEGPYLRVDALSVVFLLATGLLYAAVAVYSVGYVEGEHGGGDVRRYQRRFYVGLNLFGASLLVAPLVNGLALLWIAIEVTTVVSALLVAIDVSDNATEAAWKYLLIASVGLGIALLATIVMYYAGAQVFGSSFDLAFVPLIRAGHRLAAAPVRLAFVLAVLGFGTKVGLVPVHTWLPDAHAEAPTPVSALLSGSLLATSFYAVLRYYQIAVGALGGAFPRHVLLAFGVASLLLAALYLLDQHDIKRLFAYSSIEHMGILAIGVSFASPLAAFGVLLHVIGHAAAKGNAFMGAGVVVRKFRTKELSAVRGGFRVLPWSGPLLLASVLALSASPPFALFRSEFAIVAGGFASGGNAVAAVLVVLVTVAFVGLTWATTMSLLEPPVAPLSEAEGRSDHPGEPSVWMVVPVVVGMAVLVLLGVHVPGALDHLLTRAAAQLGAGS
ncbi:MAG: proton-conducting transporter transmembrane domain-containing protein [Mycobacteriales bacterium]